MGIDLECSICGEAIEGDHLTLEITRVSGEAHRLGIAGSSLVKREIVVGFHEACFETLEYPVVEADDLHLQIHDMIEKGSCGLGS